MFTKATNQSNIAEAGTVRIACSSRRLLLTLDLQLTLEMETLTKYTGNQTYANLALKSVEHIANLVRFILVGSSRTYTDLNPSRF